MIKKLILITIISLVSSLSAQVKVYKVGGVVLEGPEVAYKSGKIQLKIKGKQGSTLHDVTQVLRIESPMPGRSAGMWKRFLGGDFKLVGGNAGKSEEEKNRYLGWGKRICFSYCYSLLKNGNTKDSVSLLGRAKGYMRGNNDKLDNQLIDIALAYADFINGATPRAQKKLDLIAKNLEPEAIPYFYNLQGDIFQKLDKGSLATLSYYKTLLLDGASSYEKGYAKTKIIEIYTKQGDTARVASVKKL
ncbi:MAG: hypothetical protein NE334_14405 [Lentisphaeraceae bacterium]|nr:hypothetical protein [Lentisphaeraceae bacterium]